MKSLCFLIYIEIALQTWGWRYLQLHTKLRRMNKSHTVPKCDYLNVRSELISISIY